VSLATLERRARDRVGEALVHPAIASALGALDEAGVRWCVLRGERELATLEGDVDLLVDARDRDRLRDALVTRHGFVPLPSAGRGPHRFYGAYDADSDGWLKLDVVTELHFGRYQELPTSAAVAVLERRRRFGTLAVPDPCDAFWAQLLHTLLDRARVRPERGREVGAMARGAWGRSSPLSQLADAACPPGWDAARMLEAAAAGHWDELARVATAMRGRWPGASPVAQRVRKDASRVLRRVGGLPVGEHRRGPGLVLGGADADLRRELADELQRSWPSPARVLRADRPDAPLSARERRLRAARRRVQWHAARARGELVILDGPDVLGPGRAGRPSGGRAGADVVVALCPGGGTSLRLQAPYLVELDARLGVAALRRVVTEVAWSSWTAR
jgi:hypothetical protein